MHPFSVLTLGIFVAGYITARWDLVTRLYELAIFAWDHGVIVGHPSPECSTIAKIHQTRTAKGFAILSIFFFLFIIPVERIASRETVQVRLGSLRRFEHLLTFSSILDQLIVASLPESS